MAQHGDQGRGASPDGPSPVDQDRMDRRAALKKAAVAAGTAGAVWAAPRIEGLSITPDYAAAGTVSGLTRTIRFGDVNGTTYPGVDNYFQFKPSPGTTPLSGPTQNAPLRIRADLGAAGTAELEVAQGILADGDPFSGTVRFDVDPPYNRCAVTAITSNPTPGPGNNIGPAPLPNTTAPFTQPFNVGDHPIPTTRVDDVSVTITCL